jgi:hypothetical protein
VVGRRSWWCPIVLAIVVAVASSAAAETPTHFRTRANAVCTSGIAAMVAVPAPRSSSGYLKYFERETALSDRLLLDLAALRPPATMQPSYNRALVAQRAVEATLHRLVEKLKTTSNPKSVVLASRPTLVKRTNRANAAWRAAGLAKC